MIGKWSANCDKNRDVRYAIGIRDIVFFGKWSSSGNWEFGILGFGKSEFGILGFGKMSIREIVQFGKSEFGKLASGKCPFGKMAFGKSYCNQLVLLYVYKILE